MASVAGSAIFVNGCFWHGHEHCRAFRLPKTRHEWWKTKLEGNMSRDRRKEAELRAAGWHVVTIWECALKKSSARLWLIQRMPGLLGKAPPHSPVPEFLPMVAEEEAPYRSGH
jgi:DNA mismatch endonuclease (patch repair protein)